MISAFLGVSGRTVAAHAALLLANAHARVDGAVSLVRVIAPGDATLSPSFAGVDGILLVEREASTRDKVVTIVTEEVEAARQAGRSVVLDLPSTCHADPRIRERVAVMVMAVGQAPLDEQGALALVAADAVPSRGRAKPREPGLGAAPCWFLGCSRSGGGPAAVAFERAMTEDRDTRDAARPRILPVTLPTLSRGEAAGLIDGGLNARMLAAGVILLAVLRIIEADPGIERVETAAIDAALGEDGPASLLPDDRVPGDRLRDLADELQAIGDGLKPTPDDLLDAPILEDWRPETRTVRVLAGRVHGHPNFPAGRPIVTSDLYASDGKSWARSLSRWYRLGVPATALSEGDLH